MTPNTETNEAPQVVEPETLATVAPAAPVYWWSGVTIVAPGSIERDAVEGFAASSRFLTIVGMLDGDKTPVLQEVYYDGKPIPGRPLIVTSVGETFSDWRTFPLFKSLSAALMFAGTVRSIPDQIPAGSTDEAAKGFKTFHAAAKVMAVARKSVAAQRKALA